MAKTQIPAGYIAANAITATELAANSVTAAAIASDALVAADIADNAITSAKIALNAVGSSEIAANAVGSTQIAANAVTAAKIDSTSTGMTFADLTVDTTTLVVDSSNNRVGIGMTNPAYTLDVTGTINASTDVKINGAAAATTGKAIAMALVFG